MMGILLIVILGSISACPTHAVGYFYRIFYMSISLMKVMCINNKYCDGNPKDILRLHKGGGAAVIHNNHPYQINNRRRAKRRLDDDCTIVGLQYNYNCITGRPIYFSVVVGRRDGCRGYFRSFA